MSGQPEANPDDCGTNCQEALAQLERFLDGELGASRIEEVSTHLAECYPCTDRATFEEQLRAIVARDCVDRAPPALIERIHERLAAGDLPR